MAFHDREYQVYVLFGKPNAPPPWVEQTWARLFHALDPLVSAARGATAVRSAQLGPKPGSTYQKAISFGRIGWNEQGSKKWVHSTDGQLVSGGEAIFLSSEVWAPSWTICEREKLAPDAFFAMRSASHGASPAGSETKFNARCILAVASDTAKADQARSSAEAVASIIDAVLRAHRVRPWGIAFGNSGAFGNAINDLNFAGSVADLADGWTAF
jgi:hypothetical protein